ncbi:MAG TPA: hypothetical protein VN832_14300 [Stellaceae bacterium]|nr:hypothetical protein [Stellaceae bacterium]
MFIARWRVDARFGHKQKVIDMLKNWAREIAPQAGWAERNGRLLTGSIGTAEATIEHEWSIDSLAELEQVWAKLGALETHRKWGQELEPYVVSGSSRWEILRVV